MAEVVATAPPAEPSSARSFRRRVAVLVAVVLPWAGATLVSWSTWSSAGGFWAAFARPVPAQVRSADGASIVLVARRRPRRFVVAAWSLVALGALLWIAPVASVPEHKDAHMDCSLAHRAQGVDERGWSWTRFGTVVVLTGGGPTREVVCR